MNVPDDWGSYYYSCTRCGGKYHASEGGCGCTEDLVACDGPCGEYHEEDEVTEVDRGPDEAPQTLCTECVSCDACRNPATAYDVTSAILTCAECANEAAKEDKKNGLPDSVLIPINMEVTCG